MTLRSIKNLEKKFGFLDHIPLGVLILRKDYVVLFWNRCLEEWTGINRKTIIGKDITIHFPYLKEPLYSTRLHDIFQGGPPTIFSSQLHNHVIPSTLGNGTFRIQHTYVTSLQLSNSTDFCALFAIQDVTDLTHRIHGYRTMRDQALEEINERKRAEEELRKAHAELEIRIQERTADLVSLNKQLEEEINERKRVEEQLQKTKTYIESILANALDIIITVKKDGTIGYCNRSIDYDLGYQKKEIKGKHFLEFIPDHLKDFIIEKWIELNDGTSGIFESQIIKSDGKLMDCLISQSTIQGFDEFLVSIKDITDRKKMEQELLQVKKLESIGILAGGIAHDFNNLLTAILGNISLAKMYVMEKEVYNNLIEIEKASLRAKDLTQQLLTFSRGGIPIKKTSNIAALLRDSTDFALHGSNVKCDFFISPDLWLTDVDEEKIKQVINNLIINSIQAMPDGGIIQVKADNVTIGQDSVLPLKSGYYVKLSFKDTGDGILEEHLQKIFDPYFTTKPNGSGFGLTIAYSIVKNHEGYLTVESRPHFGTIFSVYLPASPQETYDKKEEQRLISGHGRILLMDDEEPVRVVTGKMLRHLGYEFESVNDGKEAIHVYKEAKKSGNKFDMVIMDLTIPGGMGGKETIKKLLELDPNVKTIVASGYSNDPVMSEYKKYGFYGFVSKPFTIAELGQILHRVSKGVNK